MRASRSPAWTMVALGVLGVPLVVLGCGGKSSSSDGAAGGDAGKADSGGDGTGGGDAAPHAAGAVAGPADVHCGDMKNPTSAASCDLKAPDGGDPGCPKMEMGETMYGAAGDDGHCKYHLQWTSTSIAKDQDVTFTVVATTKVDGKPATGAMIMAEVFLSDTHAAPDTKAKTVEGPAGTYTIGPIRFDAAGVWTVQFHLYGKCSTYAEDSPHGRAAFFVAVPDAASGPAPGGPDTHCGGTKNPTDHASCSMTAPDGGEPDAGATCPEMDMGETMYGTEGDDDDCKYHLKWSATPVVKDGNVTLTVVATNTVDGKPVKGAEIMAEVFLDETHPAPHSSPTTTESPDGTYTIGPIKLDAVGRWTVRFHLFHHCTDYAEDSPHGHAAFYVWVLD